MDKLKYNLVFKDYDNLTVFREKGETKISEIIKKYFEKIKKSNLMVKDISNIYFIYRAISIKPKDYNTKICEYFGDAQTDILITVENAYRDYYDYQIIEPIDETAFSSIYKSKILKDHYKEEEFVAVKKIFKDKIKKEMKYKKKKSVINEEDFKAEIIKFNKEIENMEICQCQNSVKIYDYLDTEKEFIIIMELCDQNLMDVLLEREEGFNSKEILNILL